MRLSARRPDDADVIRARLRALLAADDSPGWMPAADPLSHDGADDRADDRGDDRRDDRPDDWADGLAAGRPAEEASASAGRPPGVGRHRAPAVAVRVDPGRPAARALLLAGAVAVLLLVVWTWLQRPSVQPVPAPAGPATWSASAEPRSSPSVGEVARTSPTVVVAVVGEVARPGLVTLTDGARVADAIEAAGGLLPDADAATVNLAARVADGQQVAVGVPAAGGPRAPATGSASGVPATGPVHLNSATAAELDGLPGIGPVLAQRIVDHRERHGAFDDVGQLADVPGIGPAILGGLVEAVTV